MRTTGPTPNPIAALVCPTIVVRPVRAPQDYFLAIAMPTRPVASRASAKVTPAPNTGKTSSELASLSVNNPVSRTSEGDPPTPCGQSLSTRLPKPAAGLSPSVKQRLSSGRCTGAERTRTADLLVANKPIGSRKPPGEPLRGLFSAFLRALAGVTTRSHL